MTFDYITSLSLAASDFKALFIKLIKTILVYSDKANTGAAVLYNFEAMFCRGALCQNLVLIKCFIFLNKLYLL